MSEFDIWNVLVSLGLSSLVGISIAVFFRYKVKPKFEIIFDDNRQSNLNLIFNGLQWFDADFESFYTIVERDITPLTKYNEEIVPSPKIKPIDELEDDDAVDLGTMMRMDKKFLEVKDTLDSILKRMREQHTKFLKDYHIYLNYLHDDFLRNISKYYFTTTDYCEYVLNKQNYYSIGIDRKKFATKIIAYLEKDSGIERRENSIEKFISKWRKRYPDI